MPGLSSWLPQQEVSFISRLHGPTQELVLFLPSSVKLLSLPAGLSTGLPPRARCLPFSGCLASSYSMILKSTNPTRENLSAAEETSSLPPGAGASGPVLSTPRGQGEKGRPSSDEAGWAPVTSSPSSRAPWPHSDS